MVLEEKFQWHDNLLNKYLTQTIKKNKKGGRMITKYTTAHNMQDENFIKSYSTTPCAHTDESSFLILFWIFFLWKFAIIPQRESIEEKMRATSNISTIFSFSSQFLITGKIHAKIKIKKECFTLHTRKKQKWRKNCFSLAVKHEMLGYKVSTMMKSVSFDKQFSRGNGRDIESTSGVKSIWYYVSSEWR